MALQPRTRILLHRVHVYGRMWLLSRLMLFSGG